MMTLHHLTVSTGDLHASPRSEVGPEAIAALQPLVAAPPKTKVPVPGMPMLWMQKASIQPGGATVTIGEQDGRAVVVLSIAWDKSRADQHWPRIVQLARDSAERDGTLIARKLTQPPLPWCAAILGVPASWLDPNTLMMIGDLERCIAWALIENEKKTP